MFLNFFSNTEAGHVFKMFLQYHRDNSGFQETFMPLKTIVVQSVGNYVILDLLARINLYYRC